ncbi:MAG: multidrug effflux MFS transporter [Pseudomonadota bacterium]|nr:multidrug effflux MFS transporter [Pseudomonadota bacterium]
MHRRSPQKPGWKSPSAGPRILNTTAQTSEKKPGIVFLAALVTITLIGPLAVHMYIPIMPTIQKAFGVSTFLTTLTFSLVLFVMAFGTLAYGTLSDRFGRKPVLMFGLGLFVAGSALCAVASSFEVLFAGRLLQAIAAGCGVVLARAIARDVYGPQKLAQVIAYITTAYVLGPTLAPPIGGAISDLFSWNSVFYFATGISLLVILLGGLVIHETHHGRKKSKGLITLARDYTRLISNPVFLGYALVPAFTSGAFFALAAYATFLMNDHYNGTSGEYGLYFMLLTFGFMSGNFISGRLGNRVTTEYMVILGCLTGIITVELLTIAVFLFPDQPLALFLPGALIGVAQGLAMPHAQAAAINADPDLTGTASGIVMFLHFSAAAIASLFISSLYDKTFFPMIEVVFTLSVCALVSGLIANAYQQKRDQPVTA